MSLRPQSRERVGELIARFRRVTGDMRPVQGNSSSEQLNKVLEEEEEVVARSITDPPSRRLDYHKIVREDVHRK